MQYLKDLKQRGSSAYCAKSVKVCQRRPKVPRKPRVSKIFINAKCGKNAKSVKSEFKVRSWSLSVIVMLQNFQRLVSLFASQIQRHLLFHCSADFFFFFWFLLFFNVKLPFRCLSPQTEEAEACPHHQESHVCVSQTTTTKLINRYLLVFEQTSGCEKKRQKVNRSEAHQCSGPILSGMISSPCRTMVVNASTS